MPIGTFRPKDTRTRYYDEDGNPESCYKHEIRERTEAEIEDQDFAGYPRHIQQSAPRGKLGHGRNSIWRLIELGLVALILLITQQWWIDDLTRLLN